ncbi:hypothetical protein L596_006792 [Steinernema carpocapsae]|uniref:Uncharacterized protein n=1 Tax=Steinernema carpocapsae TaxID=34508 RepID=A0A4V6A5V4_STECR|nr:hypothetical protein L596_006792 [Steinernema carpocapsae]
MARVLGNEHVWNTTKLIIDTSGFNQQDKDQVYNLLVDAMQDKLTTKMPNVTMPIETILNSVTVPGEMLHLNTTMG